MSSKGEKQLKFILAALNGAEKLVLATDPDREGEAISWHIIEQLKERTNFVDISVERITFTEISKSAILKSIQSPRRIDVSLVDAYLARRIIDYLLGFTLSPVLWRKLPGARSAGRVQSACLRLICERENEIIDFNPKEYWSIKAKLCTSQNHTFTAKLSHVDGKPLDQFSLSEELLAKKVVKKIQDLDLMVIRVSKKGTQRKPLAPYRTSTLQQDAGQKLNWDSKKTMNIAQQLYDGRNNFEGGEASGLITYMRTDGIDISQEGIQNIRNGIKEQLGARFLSDQPNVHTKKVVNAQEAHEAIRPTDIDRTPNNLPSTLSADEQQLYQMIWQRTVASQMANAEYNVYTVIVADRDTSIQLRASERELSFEGFLAVYNPETSDGEKTSSSENDQDKVIKTSHLRQICEGDSIREKELDKTQHFTKPPGRYSEASLIKTLEKMGIGRPSTFALITSILVTRKYVYKHRKAYVPHPLGQVLTTYLEKYFLQFVDFEFTSLMERKLDEIAEGKEQWRETAQEFWNLLSGAVEQASEIQIRDVIDYVNERMREKIFFPIVEQGGDVEEARKCPLCKDGSLLIKFSKNGPFLGCSNYKKTKCTYSISMNQIRKGFEIEGVVQDLGVDAELGGHLYVKNEMGRIFIALESDDPRQNRTVPVPAWISEVNDLTPEKAKKILKPLKDLGAHPETGIPITIEKGRAKRRYLKHGDNCVDLSDNMAHNWTKLDQKTALEILNHQEMRNRASKYKNGASKKKNEKSKSKTAASKKKDEKSKSENATSKKKDEKSKSENATSKKKDEKSQKKEGVKKARSAYIFFMMEKMAVLREQCPSDLGSQRMKKLAAMWKECKAGEKERFNQLAAEDKIRYQKESVKS